MRMGPSRPAEPGRAPKTLPEILAAYERVIIIQALQLNDFSRKKTAASLGVPCNFLWRRMRMLKMDLAAFPKIKSGRTRASSGDQGRKESNQ